jgi:two-component system sensor histidine kinase KdpD
VSRHEAQSRALFDFARELSGVLHMDDCVAIAERSIARTFRGRAHVLLLDIEDCLQAPVSTTDGTTLDPAIARWALDHNEAAVSGTAAVPSSTWLYLPFKAPIRTRGVLAVRPEEPHLLVDLEERRQLETYAAMFAMALERIDCVDVARDTTVRMECERLRNSLLAALSHDLRTPLAALYGLSEVLVMNSRDLPPDVSETAKAINGAILRISTMVDNLLEMARLQSRSVRLNRQWQVMEELAGSALQSVGTALGGHKISTDLPADLPLVDVDAVLLERVLGNLLENAGKYTPSGGSIALTARVEDANLFVIIEDDGPGLPAGREEALFEKFARGDSASPTSGVGLGLAICRAIVEAHGGRIWAEPGHARSGSRGARFCFKIPVSTPPAVSVEEVGDDQHELRCA